MSAPDTNIETQQKRHNGPLSGMALSVLIAATAFVGILVWFAVTGTEKTVPNDPAASVVTEEPLEN